MHPTTSSFRNSSRAEKEIFHAVPKRFVAQVNRTPCAVALVSGGQTLTYQQLNEQVNQLAHFLQQRDIGLGSLVAVQVSRSPNAIIAFLSILKLGAAYVPIDPAYPADRRDYILQDSNAAALLTESSCLAEGIDYADICVQLDSDRAEIAQCSQAELDINIEPEDLAYVIYTSGTTGKPKGVMIPHRGLANHAIAMARAFELTATDRMLQFSSLSFDIIVEELYPTLISGGALVLRPDEIATSLTSFFEFIATEKITVLDLPTAFWHELVGGLARASSQISINPADSTEPTRSPLPPDLRLVIVGGEKASRSIYAQWVNLVGNFPRWLNTYGPTETTVTATLYDPIAENVDLSQELPIGRPIDNVTTYILNNALEPVKPGNQGELYIGGAGLARGYLNRPNKTAASFVQNPFRETGSLSTLLDDRLYKTGDIVRQLPDGNLSFVDRADFQVKIRGFRIELNGVASCLEKHPLVQQQIVVARKLGAGGKRLVAYVVSKSPDLEAADLRAFLQETLPSYAVPSTFVFLDKLPTNTHGKVNRHALPEPEVAKAKYAEPKTDLQKRLVALWEMVLSVKEIGTKDNFFELGGNSLKAVHLFSLIETEFGQKLPLAALVKAPTPDLLAALLEKKGTAREASLWNSLVPLQPNGTKPPLFLLHAVGPSILTYQNLLPHLAEDQPVYALQALGLDEQQPLLERMEQMAAQYIQEIEKIQPRGPYHLVGHSFGGIMAFEMAQQLQAQGEQVGLLGVFDAPTPALCYCQPPPLVYQLYIHASNWMNASGLAQKWQYVAVRLKPILQKLFNKGLAKAGVSTKAVDQPMPEIYRRIEEIDREALKRYSPQPYPGKMTLFRALEKDPKQFYDPHLGWRYLIEGELEIHDVPGHHLSLILEPHVAELGTKLQHCLDRAYAEADERRSQECYDRRVL